MIDINRHDGMVDVTFQNVTYRVNHNNLDVFKQQDATRAMTAALNDDEEFDLGKPEAVDAVRYIMGMCLIEQDDSFLPLTEDAQRRIFSDKSFKKKLGDVNIVDHINAVSIILFRLIRDEDWEPEEVEPEKKPDSSQAS